MLQGEKIYLRVVTASDLPLLNAWANDPDANSEYGAFGLQPSGSYDRHFAENGLLSSQRGTLLIIGPDDNPIGDVSYHQVRYGPNDASVEFNIGINIISAYRGKGYGVEAQKLLADYLFSTYSIMRVDAMTDIENIPEQRALEKAGFTREGILRKAQWRSGMWHDLVVFSKLRGE